MHSTTLLERKVEALAKRVGDVQVRVDEQLGKAAAKIKSFS
jgi:hypothetical protein